MKKPYLLVALFLFTSTFIQAQEVIRIQSCSDNLIARQVDSLKTLYAKDGFVVLKEASITMQSEFEMPVIVPLSQGSWYQFIFVGDITSKLYEVRMFDWNEKQVVYQKKMWGDVDGNVISYDFIPRFSEYYMIKPLQINKHRKTVDGYVLLFKKTIKP